MAASNGWGDVDTVQRWVVAALRGAAVWSIIGTLVALQVITGPHIIGGAIWLIPRIVRPALVLGALHGLWVEAERRRGPWVPHPVLMGGVTGSVMGLLALLPACAITGVVVLTRPAIAAYGAASVVAGFCSGAGVAYFARLRGAAITDAWSAWRLVTPVGACVLLACVEGVTLGPKIASHLLPPALSLADVRDIPPGSARGTARSGVYTIKANAIDSRSDWDCLATLVQHDGSLAVACDGRHSYAGGVNADGRFRVGGVSTSPGSGGSTITELELLTGQFITDSTLEVGAQAQVTPGLANHTVYLFWRGRGRKCAGADVASCPDLVAGRR